MALLPENQYLSEDEINKIKTDINSYYDINKPDSSFLISSDYTNNIYKPSKDIFIKSIRNLKESANEKKSDYKKILFNSFDMQSAFDNCFANCVDYYKNNIPNATSSIEKMSLFVHNAVKCFLNHTCQHNLDNQKNDSIEK